MTKRQKTASSRRSAQEQQQRQNQQQPPQLHQTLRRRRRKRQPTTTTTTTTTASTAGATPSSLSSSLSSSINTRSTSAALTPLYSSASASSSSSASTSAKTSTSGLSSSSFIVQSLNATVSSGGSDGGYGGLVNDSNDDATWGDGEKSNMKPVTTMATNTCGSRWTTALAFDRDYIFNKSSRLTGGTSLLSSIHPNNIYRAGQRRRRKYGLNLLRSRAFKRHSSASDRNTTEVIFRNGQGSDTPNAYVGCIFLGPSSSSNGDNKVLAMDCTGTIDVVDVCVHASSHVVDTSSNNRTSTSRRRSNIVRHHRHTRIDFAHYLANTSNNGRSSSSLMNGSSVGNSSSGNSSSIVDFSSVFLRGCGNSNSIGSGSSSIVAIGMTNDHLCLLELEDMVSSSISCSLSSSSPKYHGRHCHHHRIHPRNDSNIFPQTYVHQSSSDGTTPATPSSPSVINTNVREVWSTQQQVNCGRMFYRDRRDDRLVMREQLRKGQQHLYSTHNNNSVNDYPLYCQHGRHSSVTHLGDNISIGRSHDLSDLIPISQQQRRVMPGTFVRFVPHLCPSMASQWDVLETRGSGNLSSSCYHIAHVDSGSDCFWWQIFDGRTSTSDFSIRRTNRPKLLVDMTSTDCPTKREEHITSVAIVSDICLATSHISCPSYGMTPAYEIFDRDLPYCGTGMRSCVKLWDLRMLSCSLSASPHFQRRQQQPITTIPINSSFTKEKERHQQFPVQLPSFPNFDSYGVEPVESKNLLLSSKGSLLFKESTARPYTIKNGKTYREGDDRKKTIAPSSGSDGCDYVITELTAMKQHGNCNYGSTRCGNLLITSTSRSRSSQVEHHNLDLGRMEVTGRPVTQNNRTTGSHPVFAVDNSCGHNDSIVCYSRLPSSSHLELFNFFGDEDEPSSKMDLHLTDRYGTETDLTCLSMSSTSVVGGSADGDLFVWR